MDNANGQGQNMYGKDVWGGVYPLTAKALVTRVDPPRESRSVAAAVLGGVTPCPGSSGVVAAGGGGRPPQAPCQCCCCEG